jgi:adenosylcobinamide kinase / adenosylcobinamide-phosphate guanylyltransferase
LARIVLVTGGSRSGKSDFAQKYAESLAGRKAYLATCPVIDSELAERVEKHREARAGAGWSTIEETVRLAQTISADSAESWDILLVDCLTLWVNNVMYEAGQAGRSVAEEEISGLCHDVINACRGSTGTVIFVTNEVGMGIVPDNAEARKFRDLAGRCNQVIASQADEVWFIVSGIPLKIK